MLDAVLGSAPDLTPFDGVDRAGWIRWVANASVEIFSRPEVQAAAPGLLSALRDHPELGDLLWHTFSADAVEIFAGRSSGTSRHSARLDATAIIVMAAGPTSTTKMPGKMKITSGKINFTAVFAACSSAICRRRVRIDSLCTRSA